MNDFIKALEDSMKAVIFLQKTVTVLTDKVVELEKEINKMKRG